MRYTIPLTLTVDANSPEQARQIVETDILYLALTNASGIVDYTLPPAIRITATVEG